MYGSSCSIPACFFISSACSFSSFSVPSTISCIVAPEFFTTKRTVSPCLTSIAEGVRRIWSLISTRTVRDAFLGSPVRPKSVSTTGCEAGFFARFWASPWANTAGGIARTASARNKSARRFGNTGWPFFRRPGDRLDTMIRICSRPRPRGALPHRGHDVIGALLHKFDLDLLVRCEFVEQALVFDTESHRHRLPVEALDGPVLKRHRPLVGVDLLDYPDRFVRGALRLLIHFHALHVHPLHVGGLPESEAANEGAERGRHQD